MSGHSKWATIKRSKALVDAKKGKIFTKLVRELTTAARIGGGSPDGNPRLRAAIAAAKLERMPNENIDRAIKRGTGEIEGPPVEELSYEGYGPGGVAIFLEAQTDNKNRTSSEVRTTFAKNNGNMGAAGAVGWMFKRKGRFEFDGKKFTEDELMEAALEAGAEDVRREGDRFALYCEAKDFALVLGALEKRELGFAAAELTMIPENTVKVTGDAAAQVVRLVERLEEIDDVQKVYANFDIDDAELERIAAES